MNLAEAANSLAALLEKSTPKGLRHPRHADHIRPARAKVKGVVAHFFERQRRAVLALVKPKIKRELMLYPNLKEASANGKTFARTLIPAILHPLSFSATAGEESDYDAAITTLIEAAAKDMGAAEAAEDIASSWLRENSLDKLTGGLNRTSIERLQNALADSWDKGGDYGSMVDAITSTFDDFTTTRAELIAQTEVNDAYSSSRQQIAIAAGLDSKRWDPDGEACPICEDNAAAGWIDVDEDFPSGDDAPTAHPGCDCGCDYRKTSEDEE